MMVTCETAAVSAHEVRVASEYDVVVCGGGPAGIAAAVAAARSGARTLLIEQLSYLGGMATAAFVSAWCDTQSGPLADELEARLARLGAAVRRYNPESHLCKVGRMGFEAETMAVVALQMVREAGAHVLFCTIAEAAWQHDGRVAGVFIANKGGRAVVKAKVVIDTTADGDIAASAGAEFMQGDPQDGRIQHVNFKFQIGAVDRAHSEREAPSDDELVAKIRQAHTDGKLHPPKGVFRPCAETFPYHLPESKLVLDGWEIEKVDPTDPVAVSNCLVECQLAAFEVIEFCRAHLRGYEKCRITRLPALLGTRESRRIVGKYILSKDDLMAGRKFDDGIAQCCFFIDLHDSPPGLSIPFTMDYKRASMPRPGDWYEIPYRCLVPKEVVGLLVAGRCVSCERAGQGSLRIQPTCMFLGEAAGIAAGMCVAEGLHPHEIDGRRVRASIGM